MLNDLEQLAPLASRLSAVLCSGRSSHSEHGGDCHVRRLNLPGVVFCLDVLDVDDVTDRW